MATNHEFNPENWKGSRAQFTTELEGHCITRFTLETNGPQGGDWGHGSRVKLTIEDLHGTAMEVRVVPGGVGDECSKVEILFGGDAEAWHLLHGLEQFAAGLRTALNGGWKPDPQRPTLTSWSTDRPTIATALEEQR